MQNACVLARCFVGDRHDPLDDEPALGLTVLMQKHRPVLRLAQDHARFGVAELEIEQHIHRKEQHELSRKFLEFAPEVPRDLWRPCFGTQNCRGPITECLQVLIKPCLVRESDDFRHPETRRILIGGEPQFLCDRGLARRGIEADGNGAAEQLDPSAECQ